MNYLLTAAELKEEIRRRVKGLGVSVEPYADAPAYEIRVYGDGVAARSILSYESLATNGSIPYLNGVAQKLIATYGLARFYEPATAPAPDLTMGVSYGD